VETLLPRVPRERRVEFILDMVEILVCQGLEDVSEADYGTISDALCEIVMTRAPLEKDPELPDFESVPEDEAAPAACPPGG
jgi:hypothetical protein